MVPAKVWLSLGGKYGKFLKRPTQSMTLLVDLKQILSLVASILRASDWCLESGVLATHSGEVASYSGPQTYG